MSQVVGKVSQIIGPVVDVRFDLKGGQLPKLFDALIGKRKDGSDVVLEVQQHVGEDTVRAIAMDSTDGFTRGQEIFVTGSPISMPIGDQIYGRVFNVVGEDIDGIGDISYEKTMSIHRDAPKFEDLSTATEILFNGIKVIDQIET